MEINYENAIKFLDTYFETYDNHLGRQCWLLVRKHLATNSSVPNRISFYYMHDNHTFSKLYGTTLTEITDNCTIIRNESPWGMLCQPIISMDEKEIRRINAVVHCPGRNKDDQWNEDLVKWREEVSKDPDVSRLIINNSFNCFMPHSKKTTRK